MAALVGVTVEADFDRSGSYETDLTADINVAGGKPISIRRGINDRGIYTVSRVSFGLHNLSGEYAPLNQAATLAGQMTQGVPIRIKLNRSGGAWATIWTGRIFRYDARTQAKRRRVSVGCGDIAVYLQQMNGVDVNASPSRDSDAALVAIMDALGIASGDYSFDDGVQDLAYHFVRDGNAMRAITDVVKSEAGGLFFILKDGRLKFQGRDRRLSSNRTPSVGATVSIGNPGGSPPDPSTVTFSHTIDPGTTVLAVAVGIPDDKDLASEPTWNGAAMTELENYYPNEAGCQRVALYYAVAGVSGTHDVVVTMEAGGGIRFGATAFNLLATDTVTPFGTPATKKAAAANSIESASITGDLVIDAVIIGPTGQAPTVDGAQTPVDGSGAGDSNGQAASSYFGVSVKAVSGSTTMKWLDDSSTNFGQITVAVNGGPDGVWGDGTNIKPHTIEVDNNDDDLIAIAEVRANIFQQGEAGNLVFTFSRHMDNSPADSLAIAAGATYGPVHFNYDSPAESLIDPVANVHYGINSAQDGSGTDKSGSCAVAITDKGAGFELVIGPNTDGSIVYVTYFDLLATPQTFVADKPMFVSGKSIPGDFTDRKAGFDLPFTDDSGQTAQDYSVQLNRTFRWGFPKLYLGFDLERHADQQSALVGAEIGDLILYNDTALGAKGGYYNELAYVEGLDWGIPFGGKGKVQVVAKLYPAYLYRNLDKIIYDSFNRPQDLTGLGFATSGQAWLDDGDFDVNASRAFKLSGATRGVAHIDLDSADCVVEVDLLFTAMPSGRQGGLAYRYADASNYWHAHWDKDSGDYELVKYVAGSPTTVASKTLASATDDELRCIVQGNRHRAWVRAAATGKITELWDETDAALNTNTHVGLYSFNAGAHNWDDFYAQGL